MATLSRLTLSPPSSFFHTRNPPSLKDDKVRAWVAIAKDISHGAIRPVNLKRDDMSVCVCPVLTADKNNGKARFVHNSRRVNKRIKRERVQCVLESLLKTRNMYVKDRFLVGTDYSSDYHCLYLSEDHRKYLAFALHVSEITVEALAFCGPTTKTPSVH